MNLKRTYPMFYGVIGGITTEPPPPAPTVTTVTPLPAVALFDPLNVFNRVGSRSSNTTGTISIEIEV